MPYLFVVCIRRNDDFDERVFRIIIILFFHAAFEILKIETNAPFRVDAGRCQVADDAW